MIASLGSLVPALPLGPWHSSVRYAPYPSLWSYPRNSLLRGICNASAQGFLVYQMVYLKVAHLSNYSRFMRQTRSCAEWQQRSTKSTDKFAERYWWKENKGGRERAEHRHRVNNNNVQCARRVTQGWQRWNVQCLCCRWHDTQSNDKCKTWSSVVIRWCPVISKPCVLSCTV